MIQIFHVATQFVSLQHVFQKCFSECQRKEIQLVYLSQFVLTGAHLIQIKNYLRFLVLFEFGTIKSQFSKRFASNFKELKERRKVILPIKAGANIKKLECTEKPR